MLTKTLHTLLCCNSRPVLKATYYAPSLYYGHFQTCSIHNTCTTTRVWTPLTMSSDIVWYIREQSALKM